MILVVILVGALLAVALPRASLVDPGAIALLKGDPPEGLICEEPEAPTAALDQATPKRGESFRINGEYVCRRPLFTAAERDPFIGRLLKHESEKAKRVSLEMQNRLKTDKRPLFVAVDGVRDPKLAQAVLVLYRTELVQLLGSNRVTHLAPSDNDVPVLRIHLRETDAADLMSQVRLQTTPEKSTEKTTEKEKPWLDL